MGAVPEDHVEQDHRRRRVRGGLHDALVPQPEVDHGMGTAAREFIIS
jgi:hypothetical protein